MRVGNPKVSRLHIPKETTGRILRSRPSSASQKTWLSTTFLQRIHPQAVRSPIGPFPLSLVDGPQLPLAFNLSPQFSAPSSLLSRSFHQSLPIKQTTQPDRSSDTSSHSNATSSASDGHDPSSRDADPRSNFEGSGDTCGQHGQNPDHQEERQTGDDSQQNQEDQGQQQHGKEEEQKQEQAPPPPPHGDKSPWQVFTDTLKSEFRASKEWNESTKALASSAHDFTQNETLRRVRAGYGAASNAATSSTSKALKNTGRVIGQGAAWTWDTMPVRGLRKGVNLTGREVEKATRPLRETETYRSVRDVIDDGSSSRYGGWTEKEERRRKRETRALEQAKRTGIPRKSTKTEEDPEAGTNVTLHKDAAWKESWRDFRNNNRVVQSLFSLKSTYAESENPLISTARSISDRVAGFFAENETATVIKAFRAMDPSFQLEPFLQDMREYMLPEVLDAYVKGDTETLKLWLSAAQYQVYSALMHQYTTTGLKSDGRILDIRNVDVLNARMLEPGEIPVFILTCRTQEVHVYRNAKSGELAAGMEDKVQQVTYAIGVTRIAEDVANPETRGWRLIELQKSSRDYV